MSRFANKSTSYGIDSTLIIDLTTRLDDGRTEERLEQMQQEHQTELLIGSAPCISFRTLLYTFEKGTKTQIDKVQGPRETVHASVHRSVQETLDRGETFLARAPTARVELVYARDSRIAE